MIKKMATAKQMNAVDPTAPSAVTAAQIEDWKRKHGKVFIYEATDGKKCYLRQPNRRIISAAAVTAGNDSLLQKELVIKNCFLGGDRELLDEDKYFYVMAGQIEGLIEVVEGQLKEV